MSPSESKVQRLFVYGTLVPGRANAHLLDEIGGGMWERGHVRGTLHPRGWGAAMGYPGIVLGKEGAKVEGFLFSSEKLSEHWAKLDEFEGDAYERVLTVVRRKDGTSVDACVYALKV